MNSRNEKSLPQKNINAILKLFSSDLFSEALDSIDKLLTDLSNIRIPPVYKKNNNKLNIIVAYRDPGDDSRKIQLEVFNRLIFAFDAQQVPIFNELVFVS